MMSDKNLQNEWIEYHASILMEVLPRHNKATRGTLSMPLERAIIELIKNNNKEFLKLVQKKYKKQRNN